MSESDTESKSSQDALITAPLSASKKLENFIQVGIESLGVYSSLQDGSDVFKVKGTGKWQGKAFENWIKYTIASGLGISPSSLFDPSKEDVNDRWDMNYHQVNKTIREKYRNSEEQEPVVDEFMNFLEFIEGVNIKVIKKAGSKYNDIMCADMLNFFLDCCLEGGDDFLGEQRINSNWLFCVGVYSENNNISRLEKIHIYEFRPDNRQLLWGLPYIQSRALTLNGGEEKKNEESDNFSLVKDMADFLLECTCGIKSLQLCLNYIEKMYIYYGKPPYYILANILSEKAMKKKKSGKNFIWNLYSQRDYNTNQDFIKEYYHLYNGKDVLIGGQKVKKKQITQNLKTFRTEMDPRSSITHNTSNDEIKRLLIQELLYIRNAWQGGIIDPVMNPRCSAEALKRAAQLNKNIVKIKFSVDTTQSRIQCLIKPKDILLKGTPSNPTLPRSLDRTQVSLMSVRQDLNVFINVDHRGGGKGLSCLPCFRRSGNESDDVEELLFNQTVIPDGVAHNDVQVTDKKINNILSSIILISQNNYLNEIDRLSLKNEVTPQQKNEMMNNLSLSPSSILHLSNIIEDNPLFEDTGEASKLLKSSPIITPQRESAVDIHTELERERQRVPLVSSPSANQGGGRKRTRKKRRKKKKSRRRRRK
uniref:Uncharacterized protein n=1 Tax=viral metagenome TaxID=1070528 RepID=A0A6C0KFW3_9ZZZZ